MQCVWIIPKPSLPPQSVEKVPYIKPVPGAKKVEDCYSRMLVLEQKYVRIEPLISMAIYDLELQWLSNSSPCFYPCHLESILNREVRVAF